MSWKKKLFFRLTALFIFTAAGLAAAEVIVRLTHLGPPKNYANIFASDSFLPYKGRPDVCINPPSPGGEFNFELKHNHEGFRDREHRPEKSSGTIRIMCLGDSFTYGVGAAAEDAFPVQLERILDEKPVFAGRVEVLNMGMPGYGTYAQQRLLELMAPKYHPDIVISTFLPNDVIDASFDSRQFQITPDGYQIWNETPTLGRVGNEIYRRSRLLQIVLRKWLRKKRKVWVRERRPCSWDAIYEPGSCFEEDWKKVLDSYRKMINTAQKANARLMIVYLPDQNYTDKKHNYAEARLAEFCRNYSIQFVSVLPAMRTHEGEALYWPRDGHCTAKGYRVIAEVVAVALDELMSEERKNY